MNNHVVIRKADEKDFEQIHELVVQVHKIHVKNRSDIYKDVDPIDFNMFKEEISNSNNVYLVAVELNKIVGICFAEIKEISNNKIMKNRKIIHIGDICVNEEKQRNGIGKRLYNEILKLAKQQKVDSIELMVWSFNSNAIKFYENLGMSVKNLRFEQKIT